MKYLYLSLGFLIILLFVYGGIKINESKSKQPNQIRFKVIENWPIIKGQLNGKEVYFVIDTGSEENIINIEDTTKYNFSLSDEIGISIGFGGKSVYNVIKEPLKVNLNGKELNLKFNAQDINHLFKRFKLYHGMDNITAILGTKTFNDNDFVIDYKNKIVTIN